VPRRRSRPIVWLLLACLTIGAVVLGFALSQQNEPVAGASASSSPTPAPSPRPTAGTPTPTATSSATSSAAVVFAPRPPDDKPGPVIIVPGYGDDRRMLDPLAAVLRKAGRTTITLDLPGNATGDLRDQAKALGQQVSAQLRDGAASVDLVGYSAGGIVVALYTQDDPSHVRRVVTLGAPLHGTRVAGLAAGLLPSACPTACQQMVPGSALISSLSDAAPARTGVPWLSMWTSHDEVVIPATSARFDGARNVELQSVCPDDVAGHTTLPADPLAIGLTVSALDSWPTPFPTPLATACASLRALG
jgi:triacylglycerol esterase/lipase EstA (alpha/beta hydrolase family)